MSPPTQSERERCAQVLSSPLPHRRPEQRQQGREGVVQQQVQVVLLETMHGFGLEKVTGQSLSAPWKGAPLCY